MTGPLTAARDFLHGAAQSAREVIGTATNAVEQEANHALEVATPVVQAAKDVGHAIGDGARDVDTAIKQDGGYVQLAKSVVKHDVQKMGEILSELDNRSPKDFVNWLTGPEGPKVSDVTAQVPGLQKAIGDVLDKSMSNPLVAGAVGKAFGFEYSPDGDFYTTNEHSMQSHFGFHAMYDKVGKLLGMDLDENVIEFQTSDGTPYKLELWKGSYGSGGAFGGEIGLYSRGSGAHGQHGNVMEGLFPGYHSTVKGEQQIKMTQQVYNTKTGEVYFNNDGKGADGYGNNGAEDGKHYWNLAIRTDPGVKHEDLGQRGTLVVEDEKVATAMYAKLQETSARQQTDDKPGGLSDVTINKSVNKDTGKTEYTITYDWK